MTVKGIKKAGHTEIQPLLCHVAEAVAVITGLAMRVVSCYWHDTTREAMPLPLSWCSSVAMIVIVKTHCVFTFRFLSEYSRGNFAPADLIIMNA